MAGRALTAAEWEGLLARQPGVGVYAVKTTGILCRPGCPARAPLRRNVVWFETVVGAVAAGFRPCKRCCPDENRAAIDKFQG